MKGTHGLAAVAEGTSEPGSGATPRPGHRRAGSPISPTTPPALARVTGGHVLTSDSEDPKGSPATAGWGKPHGATGFFFLSLFKEILSKRVRGSPRTPSGYRGARTCCLHLTETSSADKTAGSRSGGRWTLSPPNCSTRPTEAGCSVWSRTERLPEGRATQAKQPEPGVGQWTEGPESGPMSGPTALRGTQASGAGWAVAELRRRGQTHSGGQACRAVPQPLPEAGTPDSEDTTVPLNPWCHRQ